MSAPNEVFALSVLRLLEGRARMNLVTPSENADRPKWDAIEQLEAVASSGERAMIKLFWASWRNKEGSVTSTFAMCDRGLSTALLTALCDAYEPELAR